MIKKFYHILLKLWKNIRGNFGQTFSYSSKGCKLNIIYTINMVYIHCSIAELVLEPFYYWFVNIFLKIQLSRKLPLAVQNWPCPTLAHPPLLLCSNNERTQISEYNTSNQKQQQKSTTNQSAWFREVKITHCQRPWLTGINRGYLKIDLFKYIVNYRIFSSLAII